MRILDTFPVFSDFWGKAREFSVEKQIELWESEYMGNWPSLLELVKDDYESIPDFDWYETARDRIFPLYKNCFQQMKEARENLLGCIPWIHERAEEIFCSSGLPIVHVLYAGTGGGAGWVTSLDGHHCILFGLEMIAECGWQNIPRITGLVGHELGHCVHGVLREDPGLKQYDTSWWRLYIEGFAQRSENMITDRVFWHMASPGWLEWCTANRGILAREFLTAADGNDDTRRFFGSWFDVQGYSQTGYYLGHQVVTELEKKYSITEVAVLDDFESECRNALLGFL